MKRLPFLAISTLTFTIIIAACWGPSKRDASNIAISKIDEFRKVKGRLPDSLSEAGVQDDESCPCYCKTGDHSYLVWYGTTLGESDTYDSETRKWSPGNRACVASVANLIDDLVDIDAQAPALHSTAIVRTFIADNSPSEFGGVIGSVAPQKFPQMTELVRRGVSSLPLLIKHLDDNRPTKLTVGGDFFMFRYFSDEYDSKALAAREGSARLERDFNGNYTVRVGDVCYALIGQIVNRNLLPVRYQPTAGLVANSPIEAPVLIEEVKRDWADTDAKEHMASLLADARQQQFVGIRACPSSSPVLLSRRVSSAGG